MKQKVYILPSLLAGDFGNLRASALKAQNAGGDALHIDIMDGSFVPNISMGSDVVRMAHKALKIPLSVHLMVRRPDLYLKQFIEAGAETLFIHIESSCDIASTLYEIRKMHTRVGLVLNPETPVSSLIPFLSQVDEVLCMTVHPGFGGQTFMPEVLPKIATICRQWLKVQKRGRGSNKKLKRSRQHKEHEIMLAVDGGINLKTTIAVAKAGANVLIAGNSLFKSPSMKRDITLMRGKAENAIRQRTCLA